VGNREGLSLGYLLLGRWVMAQYKHIKVPQGGAKIKTNQGAVEVEIKGIIVRDYEGKFEMSAFKKFLRGVYEKWVVPAMVEEHKTKIAEDCDKFLNQAKAWLDLEGKKL